MNQLVSQFLNTIQGQIADLKEKARAEGNKQVEQLKEKIEEELPTVEELSKRFHTGDLGDIGIEGAPTVSPPTQICSVKAQEKTEEIYDNYNKLILRLKNTATSAQSGIDNLLNTSTKINSLVDKINNLLSILDPLVKTLKGVIASIKLALKFTVTSVPPGVGIPAAIITDLNDAVKAAEGQVAVYQGSLNITPKALTYYNKKVSVIVGILTTISELFTFLINLINFIQITLEAVYLNYINICNVADQNQNPNEDEEFSEVINNLLNTDPSSGNAFDFTDPLASYYQSVLSNLTAGGQNEIIDKVYRADFKMIGYNRYKI